MIMNRNGAVSEGCRLKHSRKGNLRRTEENIKKEKSGRTEENIKKKESEKNRRKHQEKGI